MTADEIAALPYRRNVGVLLLNAEGHAFVGRRMDQQPSEPPAWQMPQGGIDKGETPRAAALRELQEETGVPPHLVTVEAETDGWIAYDLPHDIVPRIWKGRYKGQEQKWFLLRFHGTDADVRIDADDHQEFSEWRWSAPDEVLRDIVPFKRAVYARVLDIFSDHF
ncbi:RNA pyrophosphohydrolase [Sagittula salina]|uniref:RNA pyrophosphohydrolase n=1 Tax=Sagittula salina TaxID=2820268 RepID=A0A940MIL1_9RHOB|nr:RNA pyrophosphohydrolase [Sagittula salina]MBP0482425.1 RNA pyrophosphohydrolase [Sagittula salina]